MKKNETLHVTGIGAPYFDQLISVEKLPETDRHPHVHESSYQYGGKVPTALIALQRLGYSTSIHANVGGVYGRCIRYDFERHGVDCSRLIDVPGTNSGVVTVLAEKSTGGRSFVGHRLPEGVREMTASELDKDEVLRGEWLLISDLGEAAALAAKWFKEAGKQVVIDGDGLRAERADKLCLVDHLLVSEESYYNFFDDDDYERNLRKLRELQRNEGAVAAVTLGPNGVASVDENGRYLRMPAYKVDTVDTTGAGDVFHGAYIAGQLRGFNTKKALDYAQAVSAVKCTKLGGRAAIPTHEQVAEFMETGRTNFQELDERAEYYKQPPFARVMVGLEEANG